MNFLQYCNFFNAYVDNEYGSPYFLRCLIVILKCTVFMNRIEVPIMCVLINTYNVMRGQNQQNPQPSYVLRRIDRQLTLQKVTLWF